MGIAPGYATHHSAYNSSQCVAAGFVLKACPPRFGSMRFIPERKNRLWKCVRYFTPSVRLTWGGSDSKRCFFGDFLCTSKESYPMARSDSGSSGFPRQKKRRAEIKMD